MSIFRKEAEFVGYVFLSKEKITEWRCPNKKCGMSVCEDYVCCPHCGQKIKFGTPPDVPMRKILG